MKIKAGDAIPGQFYTQHIRWLCVKASDLTSIARFYNPGRGIIAIRDDTKLTHLPNCTGWDWVESKPKKKNFRVFISQVNQTFVEVLAEDADEARTLGYKKWRRDHAHSYVSDVEEVE